MPQPKKRLILTAIALLLIVVAGLLWLGRELVPRYEPGPEPLRLADLVSGATEFVLVQKGGRTVTVTPGSELAVALQPLLDARAAPYKLSARQESAYRGWSPYVDVRQAGVWIARLWPIGNYDAILLIPHETIAHTYRLRGDKQNELPYYGLVQDAFSSRRLLTASAPAVQQSTSATTAPIAGSR